MTLVQDVEKAETETDKTLKLPADPEKVRLIEREMEICQGEMDDPGAINPETLYIRTMLQVLSEEGEITYLNMKGRLCIASRKDSGTLQIAYDHAWNHVSGYCND